MKLIKKHIVPNADVYAYCLMKNHFHLLIKIKSEKELDSIGFKRDKLSQPFSNVFNAYTKAINKRYKREGSLFKVRFKRDRITDMDYLKNLIMYIHLNPVKHGFVEDFRKYDFSSFNSLMSSKETSLKRNEVLELFDDRANFLFVHLKNVKKGSFEELD